MLNKKCTNNAFITTPIYYPNAKPHIGTLYSTVTADVLARFFRLKGLKTRFITGTDEHGQKIGQAAVAAGVEPQAFVDKMIEPFKTVWRQFNISYDHFVRTTDPEHIKVVLEVVEKMQASGDIYKSTYKGRYCVPDETFVTGFDDVPESQEVLCPGCGRATVFNSEESYFFRLSKYTDRLLAFYEQNPNFIIPTNRTQEVLSFVKSGLRDLCVSRKSVSWGIGWPGDKDQTIYVWADALFNYWSAKEGFWPPTVQVLAKDILKFHAVYWPAMLMSLGLELPKKLLVHGYVLVGDKKMSKSLSNSVDPVDLAQTYGVDEIRYYLMRKMSIAQDGQFSIEDLEETIRADLANNLGNLFSRILALAQKRAIKSFDSSEVKFNNPDTASLRLSIDKTINEFNQSMAKFEIHSAIASVLGLLSQANALVQKTTPWSPNCSPELFQEVLSVVANVIACAAILLSPVMPGKSGQILATLGIESIDIADKWTDLYFNLQPLQEVLFKKEFHKPEPEKTKTEAQKPEAPNQDAPLQINIEDYFKCGLSVGKIVECEEVPKSEKLWKLQVDFGPKGQRQILSGIRMFCSKESLIGLNAIFVLNLKPRQMLGLQSEGMILTAKKPTTGLQILSVSSDILPGTEIG